MRSVKWTSSRYPDCRVERRFTGIKVWVAAGIQGYREGAPERESYRGGRHLGLCTDRRPKRAGNLRAVHGPWSWRRPYRSLLAACLCKHPGQRRPRWQSLLTSLCDLSWQLGPVTRSDRTTHNNTHAVRHLLLSLPKASAPAWLRVQVLASAWGAT